MSDDLLQSHPEVSPSDQRQKRFLESALKSFGLISVVLIVISYTYWNTYYRSFNIDIIPLISTEEMLRSLLPLSGVAFAFGYTLFQQTFIPNFKNIFRNDLLSIGNRIAKLSGSKKIVVTVILPLVLMLFLITSESFFGPFRLYPYLTLIFWSYFAGSFLFDVRGTLKLRLFSFHYFVLFLTLGFITNQFASEMANTNKALGTLENVVIKTNDHLFQTNKQFFYIGGTDAAIFLYNTKDSSTQIILRSAIDSLVFKSRR